jgi:hypothetical protein
MATSRARAFVALCIAQNVRRAHRRAHPRTVRALRRERASTRRADVAATHRAIVDGSLQAAPALALSDRERSSPHAPVAASATTRDLARASPKR